MATEQRDIHRIGGGHIENLRLKPREAHLSPPGFSVLKSPSADDAVRQIRASFPEAIELHDLARTVGSTTMEAIQEAGFDLLANPTRKLPNHYRIIHRGGADGFNDENLHRLSEVFTDTSGH
jgi:hypothetical protein